MSSFKPGKIERVAGPVIVAGDMLGAQMYEVVRVGDQGLIGEIIKIEQDRATVQVYEETAGIRPGEKGKRLHRRRTGWRARLARWLRPPVHAEHLASANSQRLQAKTSEQHASANRPTYYRLLLPNRKGRHRNHSWRLRHRQNNGATAARKMGRRIGNRVRGMR